MWITRNLRLEQVKRTGRKFEYPTFAHKKIGLFNNIVRFHVMIAKEKVPEGVVVEVLGTQSCWFKVVVGKLQETKFIKF